MQKVYFFAGRLVLFVFIPKTDLLFHTKPLRIITIVSVGLFLVGTILHFTSAGRTYPASGALVSPLLSLGLFRLGRLLFLKQFHHEPRNTYLDWTPGMVEERIFNIVYFILVLLTWIFSPLLLARLARAGW